MQVQRPRLSLIAFLLLAVGGCAVGPDYRAPSLEAPAAFFNAGQTNLTTAETAVTWWRAFHDPILDDLVQRALQGNHDLRIASANIREARALRRFAQFDLLPVASATAAYQKSRSSSA